MPDELFETFHGNVAGDVTEVELNWPGQFYMTGHARQLVYRSDKWNDGQIDYVHEFGDEVEVLEARREPGSGHGWARQLARPNTDTVAWLGGLVELRFSNQAGDTILVAPTAAELAARALPVVGAWYEDGAARIVIDTDGRPIVLLGGALQVTARGIEG